LGSEGPSSILGTPTKIMFIRTKEDFTCEKCGFFVAGDGYTNHCPECLWSKHVDVFPGDRAQMCGGMMEPVSVEVKNREYTLTHKCLKCGHIKPNKASKADNFDMLTQIAVEHSKKYA
jgi:hypothetical protein